MEHIYMRIPVGKWSVALDKTNGTFPYGLSCYLNRSMISIVVFSGNHVKDIRPQENRRHQFTTYVYADVTE
jgi:hypothetical protein